MTWYPPSEGIEEWLEFERGAGIRGVTHVWAEKAGFDNNKIAKSVGSWCFSSPEERAYRGGSIAGRASSSGFMKAAIEEGFATREEIDQMVEGWRVFVKDESGWYICAASRAPSN